MKTTLLSLVGLVASVPAFADVGQVKALVFSSQSELRIDGVEARGGSFNVGREFSDDDQDKLNSIGAGAAFEMHLANPLFVGVGASYINFDGDDDAAGYSDIIANVYGSLDVWSNETTAIFGKAGLSYHRVTLEDFTNNGVRAEAEGVNLANYDVGAGARFKLNYATSIGLEYRYTDTFLRDDIELDVAGAGLTYTGARYTDVGLRNQEGQLSLGYVF